MTRAAMILAIVLAPAARADEADRLGSESWQARERATEDLVEEGLLARSAVLRAMASSDPEVAGRGREIEERIARRFEDAQRRLDLFGWIAARAGRDAVDSGILERVEGDRVVLRLHWPRVPAAGDSLPVHRRGGYAGRIVVEGVAGREAIARVDPRWTVEPLEPGDRVTHVLAGVSLVEEACTGRAPFRWDGSFYDEVRHPEPLDGRILAVSAERGLVMLSLGERDGVVNGPVPPRLVVRLG